MTGRRSQRATDILIGFVLGAVLMVSVSAVAENDPKAPVEHGHFSKSVAGLLLAISSLSVDTELNARSIVELEGRIAKIEAAAAK